MKNWPKNKNLSPQNLEPQVMSKTRIKYVRVIRVPDVPASIIQCINLSSSWFIGEVKLIKRIRGQRNDFNQIWYSEKANNL